MIIQSLHLNRPWQYRAEVISRDCSLFRFASACPLHSQEPLFAARVIYDLLFFFMVIIIVLNLIFGVIIDTFADLRSEKQKKEEVLKTTCFICGETYFSFVSAA